MLKVEVPFGGENAKFGYKDGIFYYLIFRERFRISSLNILE